MTDSNIPTRSTPQLTFETSVHDKPSACARFADIAHKPEVLTRTSRRATGVTVTLQRSTQLVSAFFELTSYIGDQSVQGGDDALQRCAAFAHPERKVV